MNLPALRLCVEALFSLAELVSTQSPRGTGVIIADVKLATIKNDDSDSGQRRLEADQASIGGRTKVLIQVIDSVFSSHFPAFLLCEKENLKQ